MHNKQQEGSLGIYRLYVAYVKPHIIFIAMSNMYEGVVLKSTSVRKYDADPCNKIDISAPPRHCFVIRIHHLDT